MIRKIISEASDHTDNVYGSCFDTNLKAPFPLHSPLPTLRDFLLYNDKFDTITDSQSYSYGIKKWQEHYALYAANNPHYHARMHFNKRFKLSYKDMQAKVDIDMQNSKLLMAKATDVRLTAQLKRISEKESQKIRNLSLPAPLNCTRALPAPYQKAYKKAHRGALFTGPCCRAKPARHKIKKRPGSGA